MYRCMSHLLYASPCVCVGAQYCHLIILVARAGGINCFIVIYCGVSFICLLLSGTLARDLIYSLCSFYVNIFLRAPHGGKFGLNIHIYIILARVV